MHPPLPEWFEMPQGPPQAPPGIYELLETNTDNRPLDTALLRLVTPFYEGGVSESGRFDGLGCLLLSQGVRYTGELFHGLMGSRERSALGILEWHDGLVYEGTLVNGEACGKGLLTFPNGDLYSGMLEGGLRHGRGTYACKETGDTYEGGWFRGQKHGKGTMTYANGGCYEGDWQYGSKHGRGRMTYSSGSTYDGEWRDNARHGSGHMVWRRDGVVVDEYRGDWVAGQPEGQGTHTYYPPPPPPQHQLHSEGAEALCATHLGDPPPGETPKNPRRLSDATTAAPPALPGPRAAPPVRNKHGPRAGPWLNRYTGGFKAGLRHGKGTFHYMDGGVHEGIWVENVKQGKGKTVFPNGACYVGEFADGNPVDCRARAQGDGPLSNAVPLFIDDLLADEPKRDHALRRLGSTLSRNYWGLRRVFDHYATQVIGTELSGGRDSAVPLLSLTQFWKFVRDAKLVASGSGLGLADVDRVFLRFRDSEQVTAWVQPLSPEELAASRQDGGVTTPRAGAGADQRRASISVASARHSAADRRWSKSDATPRRQGTLPQSGIEAQVPASPSVVTGQGRQTTSDTIAFTPQVPSLPPGQPGRPPPRPQGSGSRPPAAGSVVAVGPVGSGQLGRREMSGLSGVGSIRSDQTGHRRPSGERGEGGASPSPVQRRSGRSGAKSSVATVRGSVPYASTAPQSATPGKGLTAEQLRRAEGGEGTADAPETFDDRLEERFGPAFRENIHHGGHLINFREFVEAIVRLAYFRHQRLQGDIADRVSKLLEDVRPQLSAPAAFLGGAALLGGLAERYEDTLRRLFRLYSARSFGGLELHRQQRKGDSVITVRQFLTLLRECGALERQSLPMRRALELFDDPEPPTRVAELLPPPHCPIAPVPPREGRPRRDRAGSATSRGTSAIGVRSFTGGTGDRKTAATLRGAGGSFRQDLLQDTRDLTDSHSVSAQQQPGSHLGDGVSPAGSLASLRSVPRGPRESHREHSHDGASEAASCMEMSIVGSDRSSVVAETKATEEAQKRLREERFKERQAWLERLARGKGGCNVTRSIVVDRELVYPEFLDALVKVAKVRCADKGTDAVSRFGAFLESYLAPAAAGLAPPAYHV
eukprot:TRINITY_DN51080_c0_g1_i1.p1 TRINITY_DN51080_c0_g1~~TRINITY_DN51080_c0_g1_i1.p1  ORF type:complete len:1131 (+),score=232.00 TRINITY_DN51080_c0_g1_i1:87-3395(+)